jgi:hypothetical protein
VTPKIKTIEKQIWDLDGFDDQILLDGRPLSGAVVRTLLSWVRIAVYDRDVNEAKDATTLQTAHDTYLNV